MARIHLAHLTASISGLNKATGNPLVTFKNGQRGLMAQKGNYHIGYAPRGRGLALYQMQANGQPVNVFGGYHTKVELHNLITAFSRGIRKGRDSLKGNRKAA